MTPALQTILALAVVAATVAAFVGRALWRRRHPGSCGGGCGCPSEKIKSLARH